MATDQTCGGKNLEGIIRGTGFSISGIDGEAKGLVQQFEMHFTRKLTRIYDLASPAFYYIEGPSEGDISFTKVVGPKGAPKLNCDCLPRTIILNANETLCFGEPLGQDASYTLLNALPYGLVLSGSAENFIILAGVSYLFSNIQ